MKTINVLILLIPLSFLFVHGSRIKANTPANSSILKQEISVGGKNADVPGYDNRAIQYAIDALENIGGVVRLNPGLFEINAPVRLISNVKIIGSGKETILKRGKGVQTKYIVDADYGELKLTLENSDGFEVGMKVQVTDDENNGCWNVSTAYISDIVDNVIHIDKRLIRDYRSDKNGVVSNASSIIEIIGVKNVSVSNFTADGNGSENFFADGCNSAGILVLQSTDITIDNVHVKDFNGEGISWQMTEKVTVQNCEVSGSGNTGLHPGTGSPYSVIENNNIHHNKRDGLFICWRVNDSEVKGNKFHNNGRFGICTGHKDTDVVFEGNHIFENKSDGVNLRGERESNAPHRNTFVNNIIENNGTDGGGFGFSINSPAKDLLLKENTFKNSAKTQKAAIYVYKNGLNPKLENNQFDTHEMGELVSEKE